MKIEKLTLDNKHDLHTPNQPFDVIGCLELCFEKGKWSYCEVLSGTVTKKQYPDFDGALAEDYIKGNGRGAYLVYVEEKCVGQILLSKSWNKYAQIEDISVAQEYRGQGIGTALIKKAEEWAENNRLSALSAECQDNNILASRFLQKNGFMIGGVNTELYSALGEQYSTETAVFWYKAFCK